MPAVKPSVLVAASVPIAMAVAFAAAPAEWALYDARLAMRHDGGWPEDLVMVPLDEKALSALGGWPLPAASIGSLVDALHAAGANTVVLDVFLGAAGNTEEQLILAPSLAHTITAITFDPTDGRTPTDDELSAAFVDVGRADMPIVDAEMLSFPPERIVAAVARLGHAGFADDGPVRSSPPLVGVRYRGALPSQPLAALLEHRRIAGAAIAYRTRSITLPDRPSIPLVNGATLLDMVPGSPGPRDIAAADLLSGKIASRSLAGAIAIVHVDTPEDRHASPLGPATPGGLLLAAAFRTLDGGRSPRLLPSWAAILLCAAASYVVTQLRAPRKFRLIACSAFEGAWLAGAFGLVPVADVFLPLVGPLVVFAIAIAAIAISASGGNERSESAAARTMR